MPGKELVRIGVENPASLQYRSFQIKVCKNLLCEYTAEGFITVVDLKVFKVTLHTLLDCSKQMCSNLMDDTFVQQGRFVVNPVPVVAKRIEPGGLFAFPS